MREHTDDRTEAHSGDHEAASAESTREDRRTDDSRSLQRELGNSAVQRLANASAGTESDDGSESFESSARSPAEIARFGVSGPGRSLPHASTLRQSFPNVDLASISAHQDHAARTASRKLGADAYAIGESIAFRHPPSPELVAHEVAHVQQQRAGNRDPESVGESGDRFETAARRQAASIADSTVNADRESPERAAARISRPDASSAAQRSDSELRISGQVPGVQLQESGMAQAEVAHRDEDEDLFMIVRMPDSILLVGIQRGEDEESFARRQYRRYIEVQFGHLSDSLKADMVDYMMQRYEKEVEIESGERSHVWISDREHELLIEQFGVEMAEESRDRDTEGESGQREGTHGDSSATTGVFYIEFFADLRQILQQMNLLHNLSYFLKGMVTSVGQNLEEETVNTLIEKVQWGPYYQLRHPIAWTKGLFQGIGSAIMDIIELPVTISQAVEFAKFLMSDATPETAEALGEVAGQQQAESITELANLEDAEFANALATIVGSIVIEIIIEVAASKGFGSLARRSGDIIEQLPDDIARRVEGLLEDDTPDGSSGSSPEGDASTGRGGSDGDASQQSTGDRATRESTPEPDPDTPRPRDEPDRAPEGADRSSRETDDDSDTPTPRAETVPLSEVPVDAIEDIGPTRTRYLAEADIHSIADLRNASRAEIEAALDSRAPTDTLMERIDEFEEPLADDVAVSRVTDEDLSLHVRDIGETTETPWGRRVASLHEIDWNLVKNGMTNLERAREGRAPIDASGNPIELHHMNNEPDAPLVEVSKGTHARRHASERSEAREIREEARAEIEERRGEQPGEAAEDAASMEELVTARKQIEQYSWRQDTGDPRPELRERVAEALDLDPEADARRIDELVDAAVRRAQLDRREWEADFEREREVYWQWRAGAIDDSMASEQVDWPGASPE